MPLGGGLKEGETGGRAPLLYGPVHMSAPRRENQNTIMPSAEEETVAPLPELVGDRALTRPQCLRLDFRPTRELPPTRRV